MAILEKIIRIFYYPTEVRLMAQIEADNAEILNTVKKANKIMLDLKKAIANDPDIQNFLKDYDSKYVNGPMKIY